MGISDGDDPEGDPVGASGATLGVGGYVLAAVGSLLTIGLCVGLGESFPTACVESLHSWKSTVSCWIDTPLPRRRRCRSP